MAPAAASGPSARLASRERVIRSDDPRHAIAIPRSCTILNGVVLDSFHTCSILEVAGLGRPLRAWKAQILPYFDTHGVSNGGTEAINLIIEKVRRLAHGFKDFDHYRLRILLAADGSRRYRNSKNHPQIRRAVYRLGQSRCAARV